MEAMLVYVNFGLSQTSVASDHFFFFTGPHGEALL